ncbi:MAG: amidohydrolase [Bacteroidota bacterium]
MEAIHVSAIQADLLWENTAMNRQYLEGLVRPLQGRTDLVILPEMFTTGFSMNAPSLAESMEGDTRYWMQDLAKATQAVICGSLIIQEAGNYYNRLIWMRPDGTYEHYDKRHLFSYAKEEEHYTAGQQALLVELKGWKVMPLICYDLRFPVWSRNTTNYDLLIYVANWPAKRAFAWRSLLTARAIENQAYTIGVNRVGRDANDIDYTGDSTILDFKGDTLVYATRQAQVLQAQLSWQAQQDFRARFAFLADRDQYQILG